MQGGIDVRKVAGLTCSVAVGIAIWALTAPAFSSTPKGGASRTSRDLLSLRLLGRFELRGGASAMRWSPAGEKLLVTTADRRAWLVSPVRGRWRAARLPSSGAVRWADWQGSEELILLQEAPSGRRLVRRQLTTSRAQVSIDVPEATGVVDRSTDGRLAVATTTGRVFLMSPSLRPEAMISVPHGSSVTALHWDPTGTMLAGVNQGGDVVVCRSIASRTFEEIRRFEAWARDVTWSPDGRKLAVEDAAAKRVIVWDLQRGGQVLHASGTRPSFDPSSEFLATDYGVRSAETGASLRRLTQDLYPHAMAWWPGGAVLCAGVRAGLVVWWPREEWRSERFALSETPELLGWDAAGRYLASIDAKGHGTVWSAAGLEARPSPRRGTAPTAGTEPVRCLAFSPVHRELAAATDSHLAIWHLDDGACVSAEAAAPVFSLTWSPDGKRIVTGCGDGRVRIRRSADLSVERELGGPGDPVRGVQWSPDGRWLAALRPSPGRTQGDLSVYEVNAAFRSTRLSGEGTGALAFTPDSQRLFVGGVGRLSAWGDTPWRQVDARDLPHRMAVRAIAFDPAGKQVALACAAPSAAGGIEVLDAETLQPRISLGPTAVAFSLAFSADGRRLYREGGAMFGHPSMAASVWDLQTRAKVAEIGRRRRANCVALSADRRTLAAGCDRSAVLLWDADTRQTRWLRLSAVHASGRARPTLRLRTGKEPGAVASEPDSASLRGQR
jgi:WD40 repeat protein